MLLCTPHPAWDWRWRCTWVVASTNLETLHLTPHCGCGGWQWKFGAPADRGRSMSTPFQSLSLGVCPRNFERGVFHDRSSHWMGKQQALQTQITLERFQCDWHLWPSLSGSKAEQGQWEGQETKAHHTGLVSSWRRSRHPHLAGRLSQERVSHSRLSHRKKVGILPKAIPAKHTGCTKGGFFFGE